MKPKKKYTEQDMQNAVRAMKDGLSIYKISRDYNIPETTLRNQRDNAYCSRETGRRPVLTKSEENKIVDWIHYLGKHGFPVSKEQLKQSVAKLVENLKRSNPFKNGIPGKHWLVKFLRRHPTIAKRVAQALPTQRNKLTEQEVRSWFNRVRTYFETNDLLDVLEDKSRVYNCDETAFFLCPKEKDVLVKRGSKRVYNRVANDEKECLTVLVNVSAGGNIAPPMVLYPYKRLPRNLPFTVPPTWGIGCTESGWMNMEAFYEYVTNVFYKWLMAHKITMPVALFMDGHTSHISLPLSLFCKEKGIILVALLPNSTHLLQPLDIGVFRPVKSTWKNVVHEFRVNNNYAKLKRTDFAGEVQKCFKKCLKPETITNSFKSAGIFPFDANNIDFSKIITQESDSTITNVEESSTTQTNNFLEQFEKRLGSEVLDLFIRSGSDWNGEEKYRCLFEFWKIAQLQECQSLAIFNYSTIANNIGDCNVSDVVMNMEIGSNGSIILPLSPDAESIINNESDLINTDKQLTPRDKHSTIYSSSSNIDRHSSSVRMIEDPYLNPQPCSSRSQDHPIRRARSRQSSDDSAQFFDTENPTQYIHNSSDIEVVIDQDFAHTSQVLTSSRQSSSSVSVISLDVLNKTIENSPDVTIVAENEPSNNLLNFSTPFKTAFYFPKSVEKNIKIRKTKKVTPTVATADEYIEHLNRVEKEKKEKRAGILKRRAERLQKQEEIKAQCLEKNRKTDSVKKSAYVRNNTLKSKFARKSSIKKPITLETIQEINQQQNESIKDVISGKDNRVLIPSQPQVIKKSFLFDSDSSDDQSVTLNIRNLKAADIKKSFTKLFGESMSDSSP